MIGSHGETSKVAKPFFDQYHLRRIKKGISARLLFNIGAREKYGYRAKQRLTHVRYLPENIATPAQMNICDDKVITLIWHEIPVAIVLTDMAIAESYRRYFELLWKQGR